MKPDWKTPRMLLRLHSHIGVFESWTELPRICPRFQNALLKCQITLCMPNETCIALCRCLMYMWSCLEITLFVLLIDLLFSFSIKLFLISNQIAHRRVQVPFISIAPRDVVQFCHDCCVTKQANHIARRPKKKFRSFFWPTCVGLRDCSVPQSRQSRSAFLGAVGMGGAWTHWCAIWHFNSAFWNYGQNCGKLKRLCVNGG